MAKGELDQQIETQYPKSVMADLQNMVRHLSDTIAQVRSAATELTHSSDQLMATSDSNNQQIRLQSSEAEQMATAISEESFTDGFMRRFNVVIAEQEKNQQGKLFPTFDLDYKSTKLPEDLAELYSGHIDEDATSRKA